MKKLLSTLLIMLVLSFSKTFAQSYSSDATLIRAEKNYVVLRASGVHEKKKYAYENAVKSAIYTLLYHGIEGVGNGRAMLGSKPSLKANEYVNSMLNTTRYTVFVKEYIEDTKSSKTIAKNFNAIVTVSIYNESLYKDLVNNKIIGAAADKMSLEETQEVISLPTIMVMPYVKSDEDYRETVENNSDVRMAISKLNEAFIVNGVETKDLEQTIKNANTYLARNPNVSLEDAILTNCGADVAVYVDINKDKTAEGLRISLIMNAIDVSTGRTIASKSETSGRKNTTADMICGALANVISKDFLKQISTGMAKRIQKGSSLSLKFTISANSTMNMDTEVAGEFLPLSDVLIMWVKKNAKDGKYHSNGRSSTLLNIDEVQIKNADNQDINDFSIELYKYLRSINLTIKRDIVGNTINITIL